ncbi:MAG TPA: trehalose-phosphatase [Egibacteraceae bacterium]|nr:trehalose-phosphatase [Egibacteraceae bacterium]
MADGAAADLVEWLAAQPTSAGLFLDFDGTLTPIINDPTASAMPADVAEALAALAPRLGALAIVSGRPARFLAERAAIPGARLLGLYGLEEWIDGSARPRPEAAHWQSAVDEAKSLLRTAAGEIPGVRLEDKGLAVALHWRGAADEVQAGRAAAQAVRAVAERTGLAREPGKLVEELRPPVDWDKGASVLALSSELDLERVCYVGDDLGDLAAFAAVRRLGGRAVAVEHSEETPADLLAAADAVLDGPEGVAALLSALRDRLAAHRS